MQADIPDLPCYLNGQATSLHRATVSVLDRGFIFGDGVYEVVPVYGGRLFAFERHMARLARSLAAVRMANPHTESQWRAIATDLLGRAPSATPHMVYIQVTRGVAMRDHAMPEGAVPTIFAMVTPMKAASDAARRDGVACVTAEDFRWQKGHIKSTSLLGAVFARQISADVGATETILLRDGLLTEASSSNVWVVKDGGVAGPPADEHVLEGIRYSLLGELCAAAGIPFTLRPVSREALLDADEVLLSSATKEVLPVTRIDDQPVGSGRPGPIYQALYDRYQHAKASV